MKNISIKIVLLMFSCMILMIGKTFAATVSPAKYFGITEYKQSQNNENRNWAYSIGIPGTVNASGVASAMNLWEILEYSNLSGSNPERIDIYCVKAGVGFTDTDYDSQMIVAYDRSFDLKTEVSAVASQNSVLYELVSNGKHYEILAMADLMYLPNEDDAISVDEFLKSTGSSYESYVSQAKLTVAEIEVIQQAALWYFTNSEQEMYNNLNTVSWLKYKDMEQVSGTYKELYNYNPTNAASTAYTAGAQKEIIAVELYEYFVNTAKVKAKEYESASSLTDVSSKRNVTIYASTTSATAQPLIIIEEEDKEFDLALRKYITAVNGTTVASTRVPNISASELASGSTTTATYKHRKDPVLVETNDVVTYSLTIYNEGEAAGRALEVTDVLPTGLTFDKVVSGNFTSSYNSTTNTVVFTRNSTNKTNLDAFTGNTLDSETIVIQCKVTEVASPTESKVLTNVAYISNAISEFDTDDDIDSYTDSSNSPSVNKDSMENYTGNTSNKSTLTDSSYHYEGQQDDDDFEKLILEPKEFDLALRKYITQVNATNVTDTRVPSIVQTDLASGNSTTATYNHKKDPVVVETEDSVIYNLTIYNEGEVAGRALEVIDQLPTGLKYVKVVSGNFTGSYNETTNTLTLTRNSSNATNLSAYNGTSIASETIVIECKVTAIPDSENATVLTNVAYISNEIDENGNSVDRDSKFDSANSPSVNKDSMADYIGNTSNKTDLTDSGYHYEGQEDDDDFEKLILLPEQFDLALRKYITKVNGTNVADTRIPSIIQTDLASGSSTTATYNHRKDPVVVKTGDIVTYNLTIYNEGTLAGRALEVIDQLPTGLKYIEVESGNFTGSYNETTNTVTLTRNSGNTTNLSAYNGTTIANETIVIKCEVTALPDTENSTVLTNVAYISNEIDENGNIIDIDSKFDSANSPSVNKDSMAEYIGNTSNKTDLTDSGYHYEGQEDDDDFEKLILLPEQFDLALRKYITKVNGTSVENTRTPSIDTDTLITGTTATYNHRKDPVVVETGDIVTYNLTIYNEGTLAGRALEVVDQLPTGLEFVEVISGNFESSYDSSSNKLTLTRKSSNTTNLSAYDGTTLSSETIVIECKVIEVASISDSKVLTNVAYISDQISEYDKNDDRDSKVDSANSPSVNKDNMEDYRGNSSNKTDLDDRYYFYEGQEDDDDFEKLILLPKEFDLALRKYITEVNGVSVGSTRVPSIDETALSNGTSTTATYSHRKDPVIVETGDIVTYKLTIYNEGDVAGRALQVVDQLPTGLEFVEVVSGNFDASYDAISNKIVFDRKSDNTTNLDSYVKGNLDSETITITCNVTASAEQESSKVLTNVAYISDEIDENGNKIDRDSAFDSENSPNVDKDSIEDYIGNDSNKTELSDSSYFYKGQEDDDDFEKLILLPKEFDLKLIKRIVQVNGEDVDERILDIDITNLANGSQTTADYTLDKTPVPVKTGDLVTYTFRIYNEGEIDGYASEITEDLPDGLEFIGSKYDENNNEITDIDILEAYEFNMSFGWEYVEGSDNLIKTDYLAMGKYQDEVTPESNLLKAFDPSKEYSDVDPLNPDYRELSVILKVVAPDSLDEIIRNEAAITDARDREGKKIKDRDSSPDEWVKYEDDEDYDNIILQEVDLALRKFITAVSDDEIIDADEYLKNDDGTYKRAPIVDISKLDTLDEDGNLITTATYNHTKEPVMVQKSDIVIYMLRVYNEGETDVYAGEITDYLPGELEFVEGAFNSEYGWTISDNGRVAKTEYLKDSLIKAFDGEVLDYVEVPIMCRISEEADTNQIITNIAEVSKYLDENKKVIREDRDSDPDNVDVPNDSDLPNYKEDETDDYIPGQQDDDDFERVIIKQFNLALRKWVTQGIVIRDGEETIYESGNTPEMDPEPPVKIELEKTDITDDSVVVKFNYSIRIYNVGEIEGYALEVKDYIPDGLAFNQADNPTWEVIDEKTVVTDALKDTLLQPGEYADVHILLTWEKSEDNMGVMTNTAEISEDDNEFDLPDINSTPNNKKDGEDDIDTAPVLVSIRTGISATYFTITLIIIAVMTSGVMLIKKYAI